MWYVSDETGKIKRQSTGYSCSEPIKQVQNKIDGVTGTKCTEKNSIALLEETTIFTLEMEGISERTISLYKLAFRYLKALYGENYSVHKLDHTAVMKFQRYLKDKGTGNAGVNTYMRALHAAFERIVIDDTLVKNPFYRFKRLPVQRDKKKHMTFPEAKRFLEVVNASRNEDAKYLARILLYTGIRRSELLLI
jgi:integrase